MKPNLARIPADGDRRAAVILRRAQGTISQRFMEPLDDRDYLALGRYGTRQATVALREGSVGHLRDALLAAALSQLGRPDDARDFMGGLALHHVVARQIGTDPSAVFETVAGRLPDGPVPDLLRGFGTRQDVTLEAFAWQLVQTPDGPDFVPS